MSSSLFEDDEDDEDPPESEERTPSPRPMASNASLTRDMTLALDELEEPVPLEENDLRLTASSSSSRPDVSTLRCILGRASGLDGRGPR